MTPFQIGDQVRLKSGGPVMTADEIDGERITCSWITKDEPDNTERAHGRFNIATLELVEAAHVQQDSERALIDEFTPEELDHINGLAERPQVPTREEVIAAGYAEDVADEIVAKQLCAAEIWDRAHPVVPVAPIDLVVTNADRQGRGFQIMFTCPGCLQNHAITAQLDDPKVTCGCGAIIDLKA